MQQSTLTYTTQRHNDQLTNFSGIINIKDFDTNSPNRKRISNQIDATNLKHHLNQKVKRRKEYERYSHMTLEELREMKLVSNTNGRPRSGLTDEKWQKEFALRKMFITPHKKITKLAGKYSKESGKWDEEIKGEYQGCTNWQEYCSFINDVLSNIRQGQRDYCYYIFQIMDLAKFHFNTLRTKYYDGYWEVWLKR